MSAHRQRLNDLGTTTLIIVVVLQILAALFFTLDALADFREEGLGPHLLAEGAAVLALIAGIGFGVKLIRDLVVQARRDEAAIALAKGAMADLVRLRFDEWALTAAEADVALFALKGLDVADIARLRGAATGTVRAQLARVYAKAGVRSQVALIALFMEDMVDHAALPIAAPGPAAQIGQASRR